MSLDFTIVALVMINNFHFPPLERPAKIARLVAQQTVIIPMQIPNANRTHCVKVEVHMKMKLTKYLLLLTHKSHYNS